MLQQSIAHTYVVLVFCEIPMVRTSLSVRHHSQSLQDFKGVGNVHRHPVSKCALYRVDILYMCTHLASSKCFHMHALSHKATAKNNCMSAIYVCTSILHASFHIVLFDYTLMCAVGLSHGLQHGGCSLVDRVVFDD